MKKILRNTELADKVCVIIGTRPGIVKMAPVYHACKKAGLDTLLVHTGQHYSPEMDRAIMADCGLGEPDHQINIAVENRTHARQTAEMMVGVEDVLLQERPKIVLVCGDANTNFAAAVSARKLQLAVGHVEAGLRSWDRTMPEEQNRIMIDHISDMLFAPTEECANNLREEKVRGEIFTVGNTIVDATYAARSVAKDRSTLLTKLGLSPKQYILFTAHREENVDNEVRSRALLDFIRGVKAICKLPFVYPMHPRSRMRMAQYGLLQELKREVMLIDPAGYLDFISLESNAHVVLTDSGGVQEETCILGVPCFTMRENTERWETVKAGANAICGFDVARFEAAYKARKADGSWANPFGDGKTSEKIAQAAKERL